MSDATRRELCRRIWSLAWPTVLFAALEMLVGLTDLLMVRPFGPAATAAIGVSRQVTFLVEAAAIAISTGVITLASQSVGAQKAGQLAGVLRQSALLVLLFGLPTTLAGFWLSGPLLSMMHANQETLALGEPYLRTYFAGVVGLWGGIVGAAMFRGSGDVWTPLKIALAVNLLNVLLNFLFIYGAGPLPGFGVQGAALGTVAARGCGMLAYVVILWRGVGGVRFQMERDKTTDPGRGWSFDWPLIGRILRIGAPMAAAGVLRNGSRLAFLAIIGAGALGMSFHAAVGVGLQIRLFSILPALAFQVATATLVGQAIGRGDYDEAKALGRQSVQLLAMLMILVVTAIIVFAEPLAALFIASPDAAQLGALVLRWFAIAQFFSSLSIATQGALIGAGDTKPTLRYTLIGQWLVMLPLAYLLPNFAGWTRHGPLFAWTLAAAISLALIWRRFVRGKWQQR